MKEEYRFIILSRMYITPAQEEYLKQVTQDASLRFESTRKNLHADIVDEMIDYEFKGIVIMGKIEVNYIVGMYKHAKMRGAEEKIYIIQDDQLVSMWDIFHGKKKEYAMEWV